jgi:hypothetical protein
MGVTNAPDRVEIITSVQRRRKASIPSTDAVAGKRQSILSSVLAMSLPQENWQRPRHHAAARTCPPLLGVGKRAGCGRIRHPASHCLPCSTRYFGGIT